MNQTPKTKEYICHECGHTLRSSVRPARCPKCEHISHESNRRAHYFAATFPGLTGRKDIVVPENKLSRRALRRRRR